MQLKRNCLFSFIIMLLDTSSSIAFPMSPLEYSDQEPDFARTQGSGSEEGTRLSYPAMALGLSSGPEQQTGSLACEIEVMLHPPVSIHKAPLCFTIFPHIREKQQVKLTCQIMPQCNSLRCWLRRKVPSGPQKQMALVFKPRPTT